MRNRIWSPAWRTALLLANFALLLSCQNTTVVEEEPSTTSGTHDVQFAVPDSSSLPDSLWFRSPLDSGTCSFYLVAKGPGVRFLKEMHPLDDRDTLSIHTFRLGLHLGVTQAVSRDYRVLRGVRTVRTAADSLAWGLLRIYDSLRKANPSAFKDTSLAAQRQALPQVVAQLVFQGHPSTAKYRSVIVAGLDTAKINRQVLTLAASSGLTLGEVVRRWNLGLDYATTRALLAPLGLDTASLQPFGLDSSLHLDTLHLAEPPVGLLGKVSGKSGIQSVRYEVVGESGILTEAFVLSDAPDLKSQPQAVTFGGHPLFAPRSTVKLGSYTLQVHLSDSLGNEQTYSTRFEVAGALDHTGPQLQVLEPTAAVVRDYSDSELVVKVSATDPSGVRSVKVGDSLAKRDGDGTWARKIVVPVDSVGREVKIEAWDSVGNSSSKQILIRRDKKPVPTAPRLTLVSPSNGTWLSFEDSLVKVAWKAQTDFGTIESVTIDGVLARKEGEIWTRELKLPANGKLANIGARAYSSVPLTATEYVTVGRKADSAGPVVEWLNAKDIQHAAYDVRQVEVSVQARDLSGIDSVKIGGAKITPTGAEWKATILLGQPGELTRIQVLAWDKASNRTDTELVVARDPVPSTLPPTAKWLRPSVRTGTLVPFADSLYLVRVELTDLSGMDSNSVFIQGKRAKPVTETSWEAWVDLPPNGVAQAITLEAKNKRGVAISDFAMLTRDRDTVKAVGISDTNGKLRAGSFWVKLSCATPGATIRYTLDGTDPTPSSGVFADSLKIDTTLTLKTRAYAKDRVEGLVNTQKYQLALPVGVSAGAGGLLILMSDASLWGLGCIADNRNEADSKKICYDQPKKMADSVVQMSQGDQQSLWVKSDGTLWGVGFVGIGSIPNLATDFTFEPILSMRGIKKVVATGVTLILKNDETLWQTTTAGIPTPIANQVSDMGNGRFSSLLKSDGSYWLFGWKFTGGRYNNGPEKFLDSVRVISSKQWGFGIVQKIDNSIWGFGWSDYGEMGTGDSVEVYDSLVRLSDYGQNGPLRQIATGQAHSLLLFENGELWGHGLNLEGMLGFSGTFIQAKPFRVATGVKSVSASAYLSAYVSELGQLFIAGQILSPAGFTRIKF